MNDESLATAISQTLPPNAGLAARVAQLERAVLTINSERLTEYQDARADYHALDTAIEANRARIGTLTLENQALREDLRWNRTALYVMAGFLVLVTAFTVLAAVIR